jgi:hypothetical protein
MLTVLFHDMCTRIAAKTDTAGLATKEDTQGFQQRNTKQNLQTGASCLEIELADGLVEDVVEERGQRWRNGGRVD